MEYSRIIAITGLPGLFELISSKADGGIVRSLEDKSTRFVSSRVHQFSHLESIEVYTTRYNVNLVEVLQAMTASNEKLPDEKNAGDLKSYFEKVYPELDHGRVYSSDLKKMVKWFGILKANDVELKLSEPEEPVDEVDEVDEEETTETEAAAVPKKAKEKPASAAEKAAPKKPAAKEEVKETKKAAPKKAATKTDDKKPASKAAPKKSGGKK